MSNNVYLQVLTVKQGKQTISKETNKMITKSDNTIKIVKQGDETWVMEEKEAIFDVDISEGPFRALKTRRQPWQGPEEEGLRQRDSQCQATKTGRRLVDMCKE